MTKKTELIVPQEFGPWLQLLQNDFAKKNKKARENLRYDKRWRCQEGTTWESLLIAGKHKLDNLIITANYNKLKRFLSYRMLCHLTIYLKFRAFNCNCIEIKNGHNFSSIIKSFKKIKKNNKPNVIIAHTIKGKGVKEFENDTVWHARQLKGEEIEIGKKRLKIK